MNRERTHTAAGAGTPPVHDRSTESYSDESIEWGHAWRVVQCLDWGDSTQACEAMILLELGEDRYEQWFAFAGGLWCEWGFHDWKNPHWWANWQRYIRAMMRSWLLGFFDREACSEWGAEYF